MTKDTRGNFFAVGRDTFIRACGLGVNPAVAFLVLACGTGRAQTRTRWSATAVEKYTGMAWRRSRAAIQSLIDHGLVKRTDDGSHQKKRQYDLTVDGELVWLPNTVVLGAAGETPPLKKLRQTHDPLLLRLFADLYFDQNLLDDGGISRDVIRLEFQRQRLKDYGQFTVWAFSVGQLNHNNDPDTVKPHMLESLAEDKPGGNEEGQTDFVRRVMMLTNLGLLDWTAYLFESEQGEPMHPIDEEMWETLDDAAESLPTGNPPPGCLYVIPVYRHIQHACVYGIARMRYRPLTRLTSAGSAEYHRQRIEYLAHYCAIANETCHPRALG